MTPSRGSSPPPSPGAHSRLAPRDYPRRVRFAANQIRQLRFTILANLCFGDHPSCMFMRAAPPSRRQDRSIRESPANQVGPWTTLGLIERCGVYI
jgi:hypothetical protein